MNQFSPAAPLARRHDPSTSQAAAAQAALFAESHADRIMLALQYGEGLNAEEIGASAGLTVVQVDRRTVELQRRGLIRVLQADGQDVVRNGMRVWVKA